MNTFLRWLAFNSVGAMGTGVQLVTLVTLAEVAGLHYLVATGLAVEAAILHNFVWHERWTWGDRVGSRQGRWGRLVRFNLVSGGVAIAGQMVFTTLFATEFGLHYMVANLLAIASCSLINFVANDRLVFRNLTAAPTVETTLPWSSDD